jgi:hypothetical protein
VLRRVERDGRGEDVDGHHLDRREVARQRARARLVERRGERAGAREEFEATLE